MVFSETPRSWQSPRIVRRGSRPILGAVHQPRYFANRTNGAGENGLEKSGRVKGSDQLARFAINLFTAGTSSTGMAIIVTDELS
jgi:hypothetical protein